MKNIRNVYHSLHCGGYVQFFTITVSVSFGMHVPWVIITGCADTSSSLFAAKLTIQIPFNVNYCSTDYPQRSVDMAYNERRWADTEELDRFACVPVLPQPICEFNEPDGWQSGNS